MFRAIAAAAAALLLAMPAPSATKANSGLTAQEESALRKALDRGILIYAYDQAAWHGTDDMQTKIKDSGKLLGGWIVDGPAEAPELIFHDKNEADPQAVYVAQFRDNKLVSSRVLGSGEDRRLSPERKAIIAARKAARAALMANKASACVEQPFNTVVLPPADGSPMLVYYLTPQTDPTAIPFGGHYRVEVTDGKVGAVRPFTRSCLSMAFKEDGDKELEALMVTHLLDPVPTEIHVFSSLAAGKPVYVMTTKNGRLWAVEGSRVRLLPQDAKK
jgi:hypothetical protein